jgi:hypothetical protein
MAVKVDDCVSAADIVSMIDDENRASVLCVSAIAKASLALT